MCIDILDKKILNALKQSLIGVKVIETTSEFVRDEETNEMVKVKQKISEKTIPPNTDLLKIILNKITIDNVSELDKLSDEQLLKEREKLLNQLKEEGDDSSNSDTQI